MRELLRIPCRVRDFTPHSPTFFSIRFEGWPICLSMEAPVPEGIQKGDTLFLVLEKPDIIDVEVKEIKS